MSQPPAYSRAFSFTNFQAANPSLALPGSSVDLELNNAKRTLDAVLANLALIQRDDGQIANASIGLDQLKAEIPVGFNAPQVWVTATAYTAGSSTVFNGSGFYRALTTHTSGVFATDLAALKWQLIVNLAAVPLVAANQIAVTPSGLLTTNVQTSLQALDTGKAALSHNQAASTISDSTAAGRAMLLAADVAAQKTLLSLGSLAFLNTLNVTQITANLAFLNPIIGSLTGSINDWSPTGWATAAVVRLTATSAVNITGMAAPADGDGSIRLIYNTGTFNISILPESSSSAAANRIAGTGGLPIVIPPGNGVPFIYDITGLRWRALVPIAAPDPTLFAGYLSGLTLSAAGGTATFGIAAGSANDVSFGGLMKLASAYTKTTSAWALGTAAGALDTGAIANSTWYHVYLIQRVDTGVTDVLFSLSASAPTMPASYTLKRRIGSMKTDGSAQWTAFTQVGDEFAWTTPVADVNAANGTTARVLTTLTVPTGVIVGARFRGSINCSGGGVIAFVALNETDAAAAIPTNCSLAVVGSQFAAGHFLLLTNTSAQIGVRSNVSGAALTTGVVTYGWVDSRGK